MKSAELQNEKEALRVRNVIMEKDLDMARNIQNCLIPGNTPVPYISYLYKPMEKVGGDFFDFLRFTDNANIGVFISDVSGHGVAAAFITAMIKSTLLQSSGSVSSPSEILEILNDTLRDQSAGNFVTAFYGIYKPEYRELVFSNAGHNSPYIIDSLNIKNLSIKCKAMPLALLNNSELRDKYKIYTNETVILEKGSKLILYTDGLTEAINIDYRANVEHKDFESEILPGSFRKHFNKPADLFLKGVYRDLVEFRGSDIFEDDVCIICMDIE